MVGHACEQANSPPLHRSHSVPDKSPKTSSQKSALSLSLSDGLGSQHCPDCLVKHLKRFDVNSEPGCSALTIN